MKYPFVSVIIPTYNEEKYLENSLKSIKNQDYKGKIEIIVSDSYSKDKTLKIARRYADKVVKIRKRGIAVGRNAGAKAANGKILLFVDADTIIPPNLIMEFIKVLKKNVVGATCLASPLDSSISSLIYYWLYNQFLKMSMKFKKPQAGGMCCVYRREAFEKIGGFDEKLNLGEDIDLSKRISKIGKIVLVDSTFIMTSSRRIKKWGLLRIAAKNVKYYLKYSLTGKSIEKGKYRPIR